MVWRAHPARAVRVWHQRLTAKYVVCSSVCTVCCLSSAAQLIVCLSQALEAQCTAASFLYDTFKAGDPALFWGKSRAQVQALTEKAADALRQTTNDLFPRIHLTNKRGREYSLSGWKRSSVYFVANLPKLLAGARCCLSVTERLASVCC